MLNERVWYNDGKPQKANLHFAVAASNEEPQEDNLAAFHDRFPFRHWVDYVRDAQNKATMLKNSLSGKYKPSTMISLDELEALKNESLKVTVDDAVIRDFQGLIFELEKVGIVISDRRQSTCFRLAQANAVLAGRYALLSEDFCVLASVLWQKKDDISKVEQEVLKLANPFEEKLKRFMEQVKQAYNDTMAQTKPVDKANKGVEAREAITKVKKEIDKLVRQAASAGRDVSKLQHGLADIKKMDEEIVNNCLLMVNNNDEDEDMPF
jgi:MoxR-like ATPase